MDNILRQFTITALLASGIWAQSKAPTTVPRQVRITNTFHPVNGQPSAPVESVTLSIYNDQEGGSPLWSETQNVTVDSEGRYAAVLGATLPDGVPAELFASGEPRWLGVRFNRPGEAEQPRSQLVSVPYALKAADAETLGGKPASAYLLAPATSAASSGTPTAPGDPAPAKAGKATPKVTQTQGYVPYFSDPSNDLGNSALFQSGLNVGIGTTSPGNTLSVVSAQQTIASFSSSFYHAGWGVGFAVNSTTGLDTSFGFQNNSTPEWYIGNRASENNSFQVVNGPTNLANMSILQNGNVGIGLDSPSYKLDVSGDINLSGILRYQNSPVLRFQSSLPNIGVGSLALQNNTAGTSNTAVGYSTLYNNQGGSYNTAIGGSALSSNSGGNYNTAVGSSALFNTTGSTNTAIGYFALGNDGSGSGNIAIGYNAASSVSSGNSNNIHIGNAGSSGDNGTIRIGTSGNQTSFYVAGVNGVTTSNSAVPVLIDTTNGQLGVASSSRRYKEDIQDMGAASRGLMRLRPVTFRYKKAFGDGSKPIQYGLIAEEVAEVYPELVARSADGEIETVKYQVLGPMLLNEIQRQEAEINAQKEEIDILRQQIRELRTAVTSLGNGNLN